MWKIILPIMMLMISGCSEYFQKLDDKEVALNPKQIYEFEIDDYLKVVGRGKIDNQGRIVIKGLDGTVWDPIEVERVRILEGE